MTNKRDPNSDSGNSSNTQQPQPPAHFSHEFSTELPPVVLVVSNYSPSGLRFESILSESFEKFEIESARLLSFGSNDHSQLSDRAISSNMGQLTQFAKNRTSTVNEYSVCDDDNAVIVSDSEGISDCPTTTVHKASFIPCDPTYAIPFAQYVVVIEHVISPNSGEEPIILDDWYTEAVKLHGPENVFVDLTSSP